MTKIVYILFLVCVFSINTQGLKILGLFPHPGLSHFKFFHPIMRGLAEVGHEVTVLSHFPDKSPTAHYRDLALTGIPVLTNSVDLDLFAKGHPFYGHIFEFFVLHEWAVDHCNLTLRSSALQHILKSKEKYDVIIIEQFNSDCMLAVAHVLKAPVIGLSSCALLSWHYNRLGLPGNPQHIPTVFFGQHEDMNFLERVFNWITYYLLNFMYNYYTVPATDALVQHKFGHDIPSVADLGKELSLLFVNTHFSLNGARLTTPQLVELGGIHIQKSKTLDVDIQRFLDSADDGVVYISWGSMIRAETLPIQKRDGIVRAIRRFKQKFIWKWENDTLQNQPENLLISKWLPQREILCHPNVKVFMTHGGLMGTSEAAYCGVPTVITPMYGDQFLNANAMKYRDMGIVLKYEDISETTVFKAIKSALEKKYQDNAKDVSYSYKHRPKQAMETAIWWVEYVAKTGGAPLLKSVSTKMSTLSYYCLDIYLFLVALILIVTLTISTIFKKIILRTPPVKLKVH